MRDYLYLHHDAANKFIVTSGIELKDLFGRWPVGSGIVWLKHRLDDFRIAPGSGFQYNSSEEISALRTTSFYDWGDFCFADYCSLEFPALSKSSISELLYFGHLEKVHTKTEIPGLENRFLISGHDDGWRLVCHYSDWVHVEDLLRDLTISELSLPPQILAKESGSYWFDQYGLKIETHSDDLDSIINRNLKTPR